MQPVKTGLLVAAVVCLLGTSTATWACDVNGKIVCDTDPTVGVSGIQVVFTSPADATTNWVGETVSVTSGADGSFHTSVNGWEQTYGVNLSSAEYYCGSTSPSIYVDPIVVSSNDCPGTPACVPVIPVQFPYCPARPLGNPKAECEFFGLTVLDKVDGVSTNATMTADLALIKAGGCYSVEVGVTIGEPLTSPSEQAISHVTYCVCN